VFIEQGPLKADLKSVPDRSQLRSDDGSRTETAGRPDDKGLERQDTSGIDSVLLYAFRGVVAQLPRYLRRDQ
jgi:hypothetical protein